MEQPMMAMGEEMAPDEGMQGSGGYCIEIDVSPDGSITVSSEPKSAEEYGEGEGPGKGTPVASIGEAIKVAMEIYENDGDMMAGEEDFAMGYGGPAVREGE